jgi:hypothetical protein
MRGTGALIENLYLLPLIEKQNCWLLHCILNQKNCVTVCHHTCTVCRHLEGLAPGPAFQVTYTAKISAVSAFVCVFERSPEAHTATTAIPGPTHCSRRLYLHVSQQSHSQQLPVRSNVV